MCNIALKEQIVSLVTSLGKVTSDGASDRDLLKTLQDRAEQDPGYYPTLVSCTSVKAFSRALGSAVHDKRLIRSRREPQCLHDDERPLTISAYRR